MDTVRVSSRSLITIPKKTREKLGIKPGQRFRMEDNDGVIRLTPLPDDFDAPDEEEEEWLIRAYDEAIASDDEIIPFDQAMEEIERMRKQE